VMKFGTGSFERGFVSPVAWHQSRVDYASGLGGGLFALARDVIGLGN
jgi:hypothetical protein